MQNQSVSSSPSAALYGPTRRYSPAWRWCFEIAAVLGVAFALWYLAQPLSAPDLLRDSRYGSINPASAPVASGAGVDTFWGIEEGDDPGTWLLGQGRAYRAVAWLNRAGLVLALTCCIGWLGLCAARARAAWSLGLVVLTASATALWLRPHGWPLGVWVVGLMVGGLLWVGGLWVTPRRRLVPTVWTQAASSSMAGALVWPLGLLLSGIGALWITGFAAHGPIGVTKAGARFFALRQTDALWWALLAHHMAVLYGQTLTQLVAHWATRLEQSWQADTGWRTHVAVFGGAAILVLVLGWVGAPAYGSYLGVAHGLGMPYLVSEWVRALWLIGAAWLAYRHFQWSGQQGRNQLRGGMVVFWVALCALVLLLSKDMGPLQVQAATLGLTMIVIAMMLGWQRLPARARRWWPIAASVSALLVVVAVFKPVQVWGASQWGHTGNERIALMQKPYTANSPDRAQILWLLDATAATGSGLGKVPFCGAKAWLGLERCGLGTGVQIQLPLDFAAAGVAATFGPAAMLLLIATLLVWLGCVMRVCDRSPASASLNSSVNGLRRWWVGLFTLSLALQALLSVAGTQGWALMAGVPVPHLGYGTWSLVWVWAGAGYAQSAPR